MIDVEATLAEMRCLIAQFSSSDPEEPSVIPGLFLSHGTSPSQPVHTTQWPCLAMVVQGEKSVTLGEDTHRYGVGDYLVVAFDLPVVSRVVRASADEPYLGLGMAIDPGRLGDMIGRLDRDIMPKGGRDQRGLAVTRADRELLDAVLRLLRLLCSPGDIPIMSGIVLDEILYRLLRGPVGARLVALASANTAAGRIGRATSWLRDNYKAPLRIEMLAELVGMSASSLHLHFKAATAMTPVQFQKQLRLHEARRLILLERLDIGSAGFAVGYQSASQFSREYSRHFGIAPSRDAAASH